VAIGSGASGHAQRVRNFDDYTFGTRWAYGPRWRAG